jgi:putative phosphoesterase
MRIAAIYDVHGNLPALEAVLRDVRDASVDRIVVGGDVIAGPMPREAIELLQTLDRPTDFLLGNCEREVLAIRAGAESTVPAPFRAMMQWTASELDDGMASHLNTWKTTCRLSLESLGDLLFCHATPRSDTEIFTERTPEDVLRPLFDEAGADVVICGHTHMQFDRRVGGTRVVNAGSVGMSFQGPGAFWLLLAEEIELRRTDYDLADAPTRIRATAYPLAAEFAEGNVLHPPAREATLASFARVELRTPIG